MERWSRLSPASRARSRSAADGDAADGDGTGEGAAAVPRAGAVKDAAGVSARGSSKAGRGRRCGAAAVLLLLVRRRGGGEPAPVAPAVAHPSGRGVHELGGARGAAAARRPPSLLELELLLVVLLLLLEAPGRGGVPGGPSLADAREVGEGPGERRDAVSYVCFRCLFVCWARTECVRRERERKEKEGAERVDFRRHRRDRKKKTGEFLAGFFIPDLMCALLVVSTLLRPERSSLTRSRGERLEFRKRRARATDRESRRWRKENTEKRDRFSLARSLKKRKTLTGRNCRGIRCRGKETIARRPRATKGDVPVECKWGRESEEKTA